MAVPATASSPWSNFNRRGWSIFGRRQHNHKSLAHDNPILNYEESLLIFNHVAASIRFIKSLEAKIKAKAVTTKAAADAWDDDVPF